MESAEQAQEQSSSVSRERALLAAREQETIGRNAFNQFQHTRAWKDLNIAGAAFQRALSIAPGGDEHLPSYSNALGVAFWSQYTLFRRAEHLEFSIASYLRALTFPSIEDSVKATCLRNLNVCFKEKYERFSKENDYLSAVAFGQAAVGASLEGSTERSDALRTLALTHREHFSRTNSVKDIELAISIMEEGVASIPVDNIVEKMRFKNIIAHMFQLQFDSSGDLKPLETAISLLRDTISASPEGSVTRAESLHNLSVALEDCFKVQKQSRDIDEAIAVEREAVSLLPEKHALSLQYTHNIATLLRARFSQSTDAEDITEAVKILRRLIETTSSEHPEMSALFESVGLCYSSMFNASGRVDDLDGAISAHQRSLSLLPDDHPARAKALFHLGSAFAARYQHLSQREDLALALAAQQEAVDLEPDSSEDKPVFLNALGATLKNRFKISRKVDGLDFTDTIDALHRAVALTPAKAPISKAIRLSNLGNALQYLHLLSGKPEDIDAAVEAHREALSLIRDDDERKEVLLNNLASALSARSRTGAAADLDDAIAVGEAALEGLDDLIPHKPQTLHNLGQALLTRASQTGSTDDVSRGLQYLFSAIHLDSAAPSVTFDAACVFAAACAIYQPHRTVEMYEKAVRLLPRLLWLGSSVQQRLASIQTRAKVIPEAAALALQHEDPASALEWIETGRGIIWSQTLRLRSPVTGLRAVAPDLADQLERISQQLDTAGNADPDLVPFDRTGDVLQRLQNMTLEQQGRQRHNLAQRYETLLDDVRELPGFEDFLQPLRLTQLQEAAVSGPIVVLNVHVVRCDALVLLGPGHELRHVPLPNMSADLAGSLQNQLMRSLYSIGVRVRADLQHDTRGQSGGKIARVLSILWSHIVRPVLLELEDYFVRCSGDSLPHITWCSSGPLAFLPLHAAGDYDKSSPCQLGIIDIAASSYIPSISALLEAQQRRSRQSNTLRSRETPRILAISQPSTQGFSSLPCALDEIAIIRDRFSDTAWLNDADATPSAVLEAMESCAWVHFACHAAQDSQDPTQSAFVLHNGELTLANIMAHSFAHTELAVLSACQTAAGASELPDEAMHLAAGMLMAGFPSVVATMWSIVDDDAPVVSREFYAYLTSNTQGSSNGLSVAHALHHAMRCLREHVGEQSFIRWIPFIHVGM